MRLVRLDCDVAVFGAGAAGLSAAAAAALRAPGSRVVLFARGRIGRAGSTRQTHAVSVPIGGAAARRRHLADALRVGAGEADRRLARLLVGGVEARVRELERWGLSLERRMDGSFAVNGYGGHSRARGLRAAGPLGPALLGALRRRALAAGVEILEGWRLCDLDAGAGSLRGALALSPRGWRAVSCRSAVLATGGGTAMYARSTACAAKTADGIAVAARRGAAVRGMEFVQFHPTALEGGGLVPEELRAQGAVLRGADGRTLDLAGAARGEAARVVWTAIERTGGVILDCARVPAARRREILARLRPQLRRRLERSWPRIPVAPAAHSLLGGLRVDSRGRTSVRGLYACGEDAGGAHGADRLGGDGLAAALAIGEAAGRGAAEASLKRLRGRPNVRPPTLGRDAGFGRVLERLRAGMWLHAGIVRRQAGLMAWARELASLVDELAHAKPSRAELETYLDAVNLVDAARLICAASLARTRNAGSFYKIEVQ